MKEVTFIGEHLLIGNLGKISIFLSLAASLYSFISFVYSVQQPDQASFWKRAGRIGFAIHSVAVFSIFATLFVIIQRHYFEYQYAWQHSSTDLPLRFMVSCFWEGQEGSFLLWMVWHVLLGLLLMWRSGKEWEAPVMAVLALSQVMLSTMLLGIDVFGVKLGSNPFVLLRDAQPDILNIPIVKARGEANYLSIITEGNGLNPLLQNYWMVIHPPTLFLGFAASIVPFAYLIGGLWTKRHFEWITPALPWTLFAVMILGTGIIMGAFWAYESLSFGGYWAWDPVENASLIPWLLLIALTHTMLIFKKTGKGLYMNYVLGAFSFLTVLYATFLTRSGVLGNTSVHSFTDLGMSGQLLLFFFLFTALPAFFAIKQVLWKAVYSGALVVLLIVNMLFGYQPWLSIPLVTGMFVVLFVSLYKVTPNNKSEVEDDISSREFWMMIGSLVFVMSCFHVIINTSIPVWNKLFGLEWAPPTDVVKFYNQWQLPVAIIIGGLLAFGQLLKYKKTQGITAKRDLLTLLVASIIVTLPLVWFFGLRHPLHIMLLITASAAVLGNLYFMFFVLKGKVKFFGGSVAHVGFGLMLMGILASGVGKNVISLNSSNIDYGQAFDDTERRENILLWKNVPTMMGLYEVTYLRDTVIYPNTHYITRYRKLDAQGQPTGEDFMLMPNAQANPKMGLVSNPDTRHYFTHDVFTHVTQVPDKEANKKTPYGNFKQHEIRVGDTIRTNNALAQLISVMPVANKAELGLEGADHVLKANLRVVTLRDTFIAEPVFALKDDMYTSLDFDVHEAGLRFKLTGINTTPEDFSKTTFVFETGERPPFQDYVIMKAIVFPYINLLWGGTIIMVIGFTLSIIQRIQEYRRVKAKLSA